MKESWEIICEKEKSDNFFYLMPYIKGLYHSITGNKKQAIREIEPLEQELQGHNQVGMPFYYYLCKIYINLNDREKALEYFEKGMLFRAAPLLFSKIDCAFDSLRNEPRFQKAIASLDASIQDMASRQLKYKRTALSPMLIKEIERKLNLIMEKEKPYLNPKLSSPDLADMIDISTNQLSQFLNEHLNRNFYDYVNSFRLIEFQSLYENPKYAHLSILGLAYECGFNAKTTFNAFFKREMGVTPSEFFKK